MNLEILEIFDKDMGKLDKVDIIRANLALIDATEALSIKDIPNVKKIRGSKSAYRIRVGNYRIGFVLIDANTIELHRILHRSKVYRFFP